MNDHKHAMSDKEYEEFYRSHVLYMTELVGELASMSGPVSTLVPSPFQFQEILQCLHGLEQYAARLRRKVKQKQFDQEYEKHVRQLQWQRIEQERRI